MSTATSSNRARREGGSVPRHQFPVGRRRYVPVVDAGCGGCRPCRPTTRLLVISLPSFLRSGGGCRQLGGDGVNKTAVRRSDGSSTSTASFSSSSSCAATKSTGYSASAYSSDYCYAYGDDDEAAAAATEQRDPAALHNHKASPPKTAAARKKGPTRKKRHNYENNKAAAAEEEDVGVAVEKESCDPRADFRESMVQMVVEMGLCDWDGLRCMLRRLLALNAPRHHAAILTAFTELCAQIIAAPAAAAAAVAQTYSPSPSPKAGYDQYRR